MRRMLRLPLISSLRPAEVGHRLTEGAGEVLAGTAVAGTVARGEGGAAADEDHGRGTRRAAVFIDQSP